MSKNSKGYPRIGDVYYVEFIGDFNTQSGRRPAVVFQNNIGNIYSPNIIVLPMTSRIKKTGQPTHVIISTEDSGMPSESMVLCENPVCIPKRRLGKYVTTLSNEYMEKIAIANMMASCAISYIDPEFLKEIWEKANNLNSAGL